MKILNNIAIAGTLMVALQACQDSSEVLGEGVVCFNVQASEQMQDSRASVDIDVPGSLKVIAYKDAAEYRSTVVNMENGSATPFEWIVSANTYEFIACNYENETDVYSANGGRGEGWFYASQTAAVSTGDNFDVNLIAKVKNVKLTVEYSDGFDVLENCTTIAYMSYDTDRKISFPESSDAGEAWFKDGGTLTLELTFNYNGETKRKTYTNALNAIAVNGAAVAGTWYHLTLTPTVANGNLSISVSSSVEQVDGGIDVNPHD